MILNRRIRGAFFAAALVLAAALAVAALRAAYPRADAVGHGAVPTADPEPRVLATQPDPVDAGEPAESAARSVVPALATPSSGSQARTAIAEPEADPPASASGADPRQRTVRGVACQEYEDSSAPGRTSGAAGLATTRRASTAARRDEEPAHRSPVRIMTLGESAW